MFSSRILSALIGLLFLSLCHLHAATTTHTSSLIVRGQIPWANQESYTPVLVHLESNIDDSITLRVKASGNSISAQKTVSVKAGQRHTETVLLPSSLTEIHSATIQWQSNANGKTGTAHCSRNIEYRQTNVLVIDRDKSIVGNEFLNDLPEPKFSYHGQKYIDLESNIIPDYWQGIPLWLCLVITPTAERNLTPPQIRALQQWHHSGGSLFFTNEELQSKWSLQRGVVAELANEHHPRALHQAVNLNNAQIRSSINQYQVPGTDEVPTGAFIFILIIFIIIVGPANYLWVKRIQQLHLFLITTPIISFIFCIVLGTFGLLADGLSAHRSVIELTWLNHQQKQSCSFTSISWFSGLSPGAIQISNDSEIRILDDEAYDEYSHNSKGLSANWDTVQTVTGEWLLSRTHQQIQVSSPRTEERRLLLEHDGTQYHLKNGFDNTVTAFCWVDPSGNMWTANNVLSGQKSVLNLEDKSSIFLDREIKRFSANAQQIWRRGNNKEHFQAQMEKPLHTLPGPDADDAETPTVLLCGTLQAEVKP